MPDLRQTQAFVLRTVPYGEKDLIVTFYAKTGGRMAALARSARSSKRRFGASLMPLRGLNISYTAKPGRDLVSLTEASVCTDYPGIEASYEKIALASYMTELVRATTRDGEEGPEIWALLDESFAHVSKADDSPAIYQLIVRHFELQLLAHLGAMPAIDSCHRCAKDCSEFDKLRFSREGEGLVCQDCLPHTPRFGVVDQDILAALWYLWNPDGPPPKALTDGTKRSQVKRIIYASLDRLLEDSQLKSRPLLESLIEN